MQSTPTVAPSSATDSAAAANAADHNGRTASGIDPSANSASTTASERAEQIFKEARAEDICSTNESSVPKTKESPLRT
jgi:hypothetical protein